MINSSIPERSRTAPMHIAFDTPDQPDVHALIAELDTYLYSLYPAENVYALDIASLLAPNVLFAVARDAAGAALGCGAVAGYCASGPRPRGRPPRRRLEIVPHGKSQDQCAIPWIFRRRPGARMFGLIGSCAGAGLLPRR